MSIKLAATSNHEPTTIATLPVLAEKINTAHTNCEEAAREALLHAREAGENLVQAKKQVLHGGWLPWLEENCSFSERTAQNYMKIANRWETLTSNPQRVSDLSLRDAVKLLTTPNEEREAANNGGNKPNPTSTVVDVSAWGVRGGSGKFSLHFVRL